ncbi:RNA polymerase sigma factor SigM [Williamsia sterculiae]|uniref:RNA polymerase, sigma subunit, ECF family n=1 Tax=Williamsia sterculiae TaxID=1344003 RepID=A0A1N7FGB4_9NOCA|nr:RNA polymerase sigma factor SigM [Williamsia sterculiae]SIR99362.1 RNA polymerase, sigma subunit, ECF family [Williamsia sterculiae]
MNLPGQYPVPRDPRTDEQLLADHVAGDAEAFGIIYLRHRDHLWAVARRTSHSSEDAADALHDALLKAQRMAHGFRADARVSSWLHRIVVNSCLDLIRRNKVRHTVPLPPQDHTIFADPRDATADVDLGLAIGRVLQTLPAEQRAAVIAVDVEGLSVTEAATLLGVPAGTIKSRCSRGRAKLAEALHHLRPTDAPTAPCTGSRRT